MATETTEAHRETPRFSRLQQLKSASAPEPFDFFSLQDPLRLQRLLQTSTSRDVYARSALYYWLTGRGNVTRFKNKHGIIISTPHPNIPKASLYFFPFAEQSVDLAQQINDLRRYDKSIKVDTAYLARIPEAIANEFLEQRDNVIPRHLTIERIDEKYLDWAFPSYDISLEKLIEAKGSDMTCFRKKSRKFSEREVSVVPIKALSRLQIRGLIHEISHQWARNSLIHKDALGPTADEATLVAPYNWLASFLSEQHQFNGVLFDGIFLKRQDEYIGFGIWEKVSRGTTVPGIAALPKTYEKGLSEYLYLQIAHILMQENHTTMCIGGSETEGLDRFKRKLAPVAEHRLCTLKLLVKSSTTTRPLRAPHKLALSARPFP